jgi:hypothetical protein
MGCLFKHMRTHRGTATDETAQDDRVRTYPEEFPSGYHCTWYIRLQHENFNSRNYPALIYPAQAAREKLYLRLAE